MIEFLYLNKNRNLIKKKIKADAIITDQINLPIAVLTADCVPILIFDNQRKMIAAIHAGWKGAFKDIIKKVINFLLKNISSPTFNFSRTNKPFEVICIPAPSFLIDLSFSKTVTSCPSLRKNRAEHNPDTPAPIIATLNLLGLPRPKFSSSLIVPMISFAPLVSLLSFNT